MNLSAYEFEEEKKTFNQNDFQFAASDSYSFVTNNYEPETIEEEPEEKPDRIKNFVSDTSPIGVLKKGTLIFLGILYILWFSAQYLTTITSNGQVGILPHRIIINMFQNPMLALLTALVALLLSGVIMALLLKKEVVSNDMFERSTSNNMGSADFSTDATMKGATIFSEINNPKGICLGRKIMDMTKEWNSVCVDQSLGRNMNFAIFGSTGAGKSYSFSKPNLLTRISRGESYFVTDPSGELYRDTAAIAEANGFEVRVLNLKNLSASSGWNPFDTLRSAEMTEIQQKVTMLAHTILSNTTDENAKGDVFFDQSEENLLKALILYVAVSPNFKGEDHERHLGTVYDLLTKLAAQEGILEEFSELPDNDLAAAPWKMFQGAGRLKSNFITGLASRIEIFQTDMVKEVFSHSEIDLFAPGERKCAYYVISSISNDKMRFLLSLFFSCAFEQLITEAEDNMSGKLNIPVYFILDEFKAIGRINSFADKVANVRKYGISISMIFQDMNQLEQAYPHDFKSLLSNCDTWLALGVNDLDTAKLLSDRSGVTTIIDTKVSKSQLKHAPWEPLDPMLKYSEGNVKRNLMNPDEIFHYFDNMGDGERKVIIFARSKYPYCINSYDWHLHRLARYVDMPEYKKHANSYIPPWQKKEHTLNKKRSFLTLDSTPQFGGKAFEPQRSYTPQTRSEYKEEPRAEDVAKKKGIVFNSEAKSTHLVELGLDLTGKKKV